jgi:hypothetical protein
MRNLNIQRQIQKSKRNENTVIPSTSDIRKIVGASNRFGNRGIKNQQFTTFEIFDYLPLTAGTGTFNFFQNVNTRQFPFTNIQENRLQVGETMVINRVWFTLITIVPATNPVQIASVQTYEQAGLTALYMSQFNWLNDNNRVIKDLSLTNMQAEFNRKGWSTDNNVFHLETEITIQPLIRFACQLQKVAQAVVPANTFLGCHAGGVGTLLAPKTTY